MKKAVFRRDENTEDNYKYIDLSAVNGKRSKVQFLRKIR
jgi:hypothetical protein